MRTRASIASVESEWGVFGSPPLGNALHAVQDSFAPMHVKRQLNRDGTPGGIVDIFWYDGQDKDEHSRGDHAWANADGSLSDSGRLAVDASKALITSLLTSAIKGAHNDRVADEWLKFQFKWLLLAPIQMDPYYKPQTSGQFVA